MSQEIRLNIEAEGVKPEPQFKDWEIDDAVRTLVRAEEIKQDIELMAVIKPKLEKQAKAVLNASQVLYGTNKEGENTNDKG